MAPHKSDSSEAVRKGALKHFKLEYIISTGEKLGRQYHTQFDPISRIAEHQTAHSTGKGLGNFLALEP